MKKQMLSACLAIAASCNSAQAEMQHSPDKQDLTPPHAVEMHLDGFHNYKGEDKLPKHKQLQLRVSHYCKQLSPDLFQCIIYQGTGKEARLIGTEHVISNKLYKDLPSGEKKYWHPHDGEVDSGMLRAPGMETEKEKATLEFLKSTWGKTWHVWQPGDELPIGTPRLMWAVPKGDANDQTKAAIEKRKTDYRY